MLPSGLIREDLKNFPFGAYKNNPGQVTISSSQTTLVVPGNVFRRGVTLKNIDAAIVIYIVAAGATVTTSGFPLKAGESISLDTVGPVFALAASGSPLMAFIETSN